MSELPMSAALAGGIFFFFFNTDVDLLVWKQQTHGGVVSLRQARQEVDSEVRGLKVQGGKFQLLLAVPVHHPAIKKQGG